MIEEAVILAAGYGTRLGGSAEGKPKPLVEIAKGKPVISYIIERLERANVQNVYIVTNSYSNNNSKTFYEFFLEWRKNLKTDLAIKILNDGTSRLEDRLGAVGDLDYVLQQEKLEGSILVISGDNLFDFELVDMMHYFSENQKDLVALSEEDDIEKLRGLGIVRTDNRGKITLFEEKPENPSSTLFANCIYIFTPATLKKIPVYLSEGNDPDKPGSFIQWLYTREEVFGYINDGSFIDIGTSEALRKARDEYKAKDMYG